MSNETQIIKEMKKDIYVDELMVTFNDIQNEILRAKEKYPDDFNSFHEGYAVILEEMDELWDEIKKKNIDREKIKTEALQTAAMLCRLLVELI